MLTNKQKYRRKSDAAPQAAVPQNPVPLPPPAVDLVHMAEGIDFEDATLYGRVCSSIIQLTKELETIQRLKKLEKPLTQKLKALLKLEEQLQIIQQQIAETGIVLEETHLPEFGISTEAVEPLDGVTHDDF